MEKEKDVNGQRMGSLFRRPLYGRDVCRDHLRRTHLHLRLRFAIPTIAKIGFSNFALGDVWKPSQNIFGILPMIVGSLVVTPGAAVIGVPVGIPSAVFMAFYCPKKIKRYLQAGINLLAGIPSVVFGLWALEFVVPLIRDTFGGTGVSLLAAMLLLGFMILPTVIPLAQSSGGRASRLLLCGRHRSGATKERAIFTVVVPAAISGVLSSIIMGVSDAIGETMAVQMVIGNQPLMPTWTSPKAEGR